ncbi:hypothetical protein AOT11_22070 [Vibrio vulnificus NBRC 15645 = ATCC 27562]|nr:hypothetical protein AOT11_22070 [Vibrio vulnificus NBRC 15645 = ATCC 27562]
MSPAIVAASFVPLMVTFTTCGVPSTDVTVKLSTLLSPTFISLNALFATNVHAPLASMLNVPLVLDGLRGEAVVGVVHIF